MKEYEVLNERTQVKEILNESQIAEMLLPPMFSDMLKRLKINETMFHHLTMLTFKRIK